MRGRPSKYTPTVAKKICEEIAKGGSVRKISQQERFPSFVTIFAWLNKHEDFLKQYINACNVRAELFAEDIIDIADNDKRDFSLNDDGELVVNGEHIKRSQVRINARQWLASKHHPKRYGDRSAVEMSGPNGTAISPIQIYLPQKGSIDKNKKA